MKNKAYLAYMAIALGSFGQHILHAAADWKLKDIRAWKPSDEAKKHIAEAVRSSGFTFTYEDDPVTFYVWSKAHDMPYQLDELQEVIDKIENPEKRAFEHKSLFGNTVTGTISLENLEKLKERIIKDIKENLKEHDQLVDASPDWLKAMLKARFRDKVYNNPDKKNHKKLFDTYIFSK